MAEPPASDAEDEDERPPRAGREGLALCLSGGGYRAALFHLGGIRRLNELGVLPKISTISSVSGGSIVAGFLASRLDPWPTAAGDPRLDDVADEIRSLTKHNIRVVPSVRWVERAYRRWIGPQTLAELSDTGPRFAFCATDLANGVNWIFRRSISSGAEKAWEAGSYRAGYAPAGHLPLARIVAASSAFPPVLGPVSLPIAASDYQRASDGINSNVRLTDGGVYDNLGLEPVWKSHASVLVSDGGATLDSEPYSRLKPWKRFGRYLGIATGQGGSIRKRWLIASYDAHRNGAPGYEGAYFGVGSALSGYGTRHSDVYPDEFVDDVISEVRTDLDVFSDGEAAVLQNQGYLVCDAGVRSWAPTLAEDCVEPSPPFVEWMDGHSAERALTSSHTRRWPFGRLR